MSPPPTSQVPGRQGAPPPPPPPPPPLTHTHTPFHRCCSYRKGKVHLLEVFRRGTLLLESHQTPTPRRPLPQIFGWQGAAAVPRAAGRVPLRPHRLGALPGVVAGPAPERGLHRVTWHATSATTAPASWTAQMLTWPPVGMTACDSPSAKEGVVRDRGALVCESRS